jgi:hypothetical protein
MCDGFPNRETSCKRQISALDVHSLLLLSLLAVHSGPARSIVGLLINARGDDAVAIGLAPVGGLAIHHLQRSVNPDRCIAQIGETDTVSVWTVNGVRRSNAVSTMSGASKFKRRILVT